MTSCTVTCPRPCGRPTIPLSKPCSQKETLLRSIWRDRQRQVHSSRLQLLPWWKTSRQKIQTTSGKFPSAKDLVNVLDEVIKSKNKSWCPRINVWFKVTGIFVGVYSVRRRPFWFCFAGASSPMTRRLHTFSTRPWCATRSGTWGCWRTCGSGGRATPSGSPTSPAWRGTKCSASRPGPTGEGQPGRLTAVPLPVPSEIPFCQVSPVFCCCAKGMLCAPCWFRSGREILPWIQIAGRSAMIRRALIFNNQLSECKDTHFVEDSRTIFLCPFRSNFT